MSYTDILNVPEIEPSLKHPTVFKKFDALHLGEGLLLINDHDPIPLFYELKAERGNSFEWQKLEDGPQNWKVLITKLAKPDADQQTFNQETEKINNSNFILNVTL